MSKRATNAERYLDKRFAADPALKRRVDRAIKKLDEKGKKANG